MAWYWLALSFVILFLSFLQHLLRKTDLPPGPIALPLIGHLHLLGKNLSRDLHRLAAKHGPIIFLRLGTIPAVVVSSAAGAELVLKTHDLAFAGRTHHQAARYIGYDQRNILFAPYGAYWRNMRRLCTVELLSSAKINEFRPIRRAGMGEMVGSLRRDAERGEIVDLTARVSGVLGDMNCLMVFGRKYVDRDLDEKLGFKAVIDETLQVAAIPNLGDFFPFIAALDVQGLDRRMKKLSSIFDAFLDKIIDDHLQRKLEKTHNHDFVDTMLAVMDSGEAGFEFDRRHVKAVLLDILIGGMDTTLSTVEWAISELIRHPKVTKKLQNELERIVSLDQMVDESHLDKLEYLDLVIKETLRLHPPGRLLVHESMENCTVNGFHIPKGTWTFVNIWTIGRDPNFWHEPDEFVPERFVGENVDLLGQHFQLIPFGSGRRSCPGQQLGLTLVKLVVAQLVHCFDWELPDGVEPRDLDMTEHFGIVTSRDKHLMAIPSYRLYK
ncbi:cytochrome P450 71AU50-like [Salvia hispanica]|uniref:cytochrome P450 71AU50-like n=1 Tax=Salvia hispanica TaxID=49212 RepID=UPI002009094C|nr:cytochrome P450 71AU50-like [Salvia hispanica]